MLYLKHGLLSVCHTVYVHTTMMAKGILYPIHSSLQMKLKFLDKLYTSLDRNKDFVPRSDLYICLIDLSSTLNDSSTLNNLPW